MRRTRRKRKRRRRIETEMIKLGEENAYAGVTISNSGWRYSALI
jgi:hypothetical protein